MKDALGKHVLCGRKGQESSTAQLSGNGGRTVERSIQENTVRGLILDGQNVCSDFSIPSYRKTRMNFWVSAIVPESS